VGGAALVSLAARTEIPVHLLVALANESGASTAALPCPHLLLVEGVPAISVGAAGALVAEVELVVVAAHVGILPYLGGFARRVGGRFDTGVCPETGRFSFHWGLLD